MLTNCCCWQGDQNPRPKHDSAEFSETLFSPPLLRFYTRWKEWESWYSQSFGLHFSLREEQWQEDWAFILSLASQVIMRFPLVTSSETKKWPCLVKRDCVLWGAFLKLTLFPVKFTAWLMRCTSVRPSSLVRRNVYHVSRRLPASMVLHFFEFLKTEWIDLQVLSTEGRIWAVWSS